MGLLRQGLDPGSASDCLRYCERRSEGELLSLANLLDSHQRPASMAIAPDNAPRGVLRLGGSGTVLGVQACRRSKLQSVSDLSVQYAIPRGKPDVPLWLLRAYRTVTMSSPLPAYEAGAARRRLTACQEASGAITPEVFAYREGVATCTPVLVARAAAEESLRLHASVAIGDHDESDAFFRIVREDTASLLPVGTGEWNFGTWAADFYSRQAMCPSTSSGLAPPYRSGEGHSQGCAFAADGYQAIGGVINASLPLSSDVALPHEGTSGLPVCRISFSDDRRFFAPNLERLVPLSRQCERVSAAACRMVNPHKLRFVLVVLARESLRLVDVEVPTFEQSTSLDPPLLLNVPILHSLPVQSALGPRVAKMRRVYQRVRDPALPPSLQMRAFRAFALGSLDYVLQSVLISEHDLKGAQVTVNNAHRVALGAPKWTHLALLQLPLERGGAGAAELGTRSALLLATSYMTVSLGRNVLGRAAVQALVLSSQPYGEGPALAARLRPLRLHLLAVTDSVVVREAPIVSTGSLERLRDLDWCFAGTDGSVKGDRLGAAFALWHPSLGFFFEASVGCRAVAAHSTDAEWLARILLAHLLHDWSGSILLASDSTGASPCALSRAPKPGTVMDALFRATCRSRVHRTALDAWIPAQHDSGDAGTLALLNAEADRLAGEAADRSRPYDLPLKPLLAGRVVGVAAGAVCLSPSKAAASLYETHAVAKFAAAFPAADPLWSGKAFTRLLLSGALCPRVIRLAFLLRALDLQGNPPGMASTLCPFCELSAPDMRHHVWESCPDAFLRLTCVRGSVVSLLRDLAPPSLLNSGASMGAVRDGALPEQGQTLVQMSYSGLWRVSIPPADKSYVSVTTQAAVTLKALPLLAERPTVAGALEFAALEPPMVPPVLFRDDLRVLDPAARALTVKESVVLGLVLRSVRDWFLVLVAVPSLPIPRQAPSERREEVRIISLLGAEAYALEVWLAASVDPAVPRLAVLASPLVASLVIVHLGRALTEVRIHEVSVLLSPGLSLDDVLGLRPDRPRPQDLE